MRFARWCSGLVIVVVAAGTVLACGSGSSAAADGCAALRAGAGSGPAALRAAFPVLARPTDGRLRLPRALRAVPGTRVVYPAGARLWAAFEGHAYWVIPARDCDGAPVACIQASAGHRRGAVHCTRDRRGSSAMSTRGSRHVVGFSPNAGGTAQLTYAGGGRFAQVHEGVFASVLPGPLDDDVAFEGGPDRGQRSGPIVIIDQSGRPGGSARATERLQAAFPYSLTYQDRRVIDLGRALAGLRRRTTVLHVGDVKAAAGDVADILGAGAPKAMTPQQHRTFGFTALIVVLVGRDYRGLGR